VDEYASIRWVSRSSTAIMRASSPAQRVATSAGMLSPWPVVAVPIPVA